MQMIEEKDSKKKTPLESNIVELNIPKKHFEYFSVKKIT